MAVSGKVVIAGAVAVAAASASLVFRSPPDRADVPIRKPLRVLFVGNSYTSVNDVPSLVRALGAASEDARPLEAIVDAPGGATLKEHWAEGRDVALLGSQHVDWIVLQEQSQVSSFAPAQREEQMDAYVTKLDEAARAAGARTLLFETWGHRDGDRDDVRDDTYEAMQARIDTGYGAIGAKLGVPVAPVGFAWRHAPDALRATLWQPDGTHASLAGSYLAACVLYTRIFHRSPVGNGFTAGLDAATARTLQELAAGTMAP